MDKASYKSNNPFIDRLLDEIRDGIAAKVAGIEAHAARLVTAVDRFECAVERFEVAALRLTPEPATPAVAKSAPRWFDSLIGRN